jgi:hypothetical protein
VLVCGGGVFQILGRSGKTGRSYGCLSEVVFTTDKVRKYFFWWESWGGSFGELSSQDCRPMPVEKCGKRRPSAATRQRHGFKKHARVGGRGDPYTKGP